MMKKVRLQNFLKRMVSWLLVATFVVTAPTTTFANGQTVWDFSRISVNGSEFNIVPILNSVGTRFVFIHLDEVSFVVADTHTWSAHVYDVFQSHTLLVEASADAYTLATSVGASSVQSSIPAGVMILNFDSVSATRNAFFDISDMGIWMGVYTVTPYVYVPWYVPRGEEVSILSYSWPYGITIASYFGRLQGWNVIYYPLFQPTPFWKPFLIGIAVLVGSTAVTTATSWGTTQALNTVTGGGSSQVGGGSQGGGGSQVGGGSQGGGGSQVGGGSQNNEWQLQQEIQRLNQQVQQLQQQQQQNPQLLHEIQQLQWQIQRLEQDAQQHQQQQQQHPQLLQEIQQLQWQIQRLEQDAQQHPQILQEMQQFNQQIQQQQNQQHQQEVQQLQWQIQQLHQQMYQRETQQLQQQFQQQQNQQHEVQQLQQQVQQLQQQQEMQQLQQQLQQLLGQQEQRPQQPRRHTVNLFIGHPEMDTPRGRVSIDSNGTYPVIRNGRTLLPVRAIIEEMGGTVEWIRDGGGDGWDQITVRVNGYRVSMWVGYGSFYVNGNRRSFEIPPQIINGRTMIPARALFEAVGFTVDWRPNGGGNGFDMISVSQAA